MERPIRPEAIRIMAEMERELSPEFSPEDSRLYVERKREKPLVVRYDIIHMAYFALSLSLTDTNLILIVPGLEKKLSLQTYGHELTHTLRGEAPHYNITLAECLARGVHFFNSIHKDADGIYDSPKEDIAESVGQFMLACYLRKEQSLPSVIKRMYRYG